MKEVQAQDAGLYPGRGTPTYLAGGGQTDPRHRADLGSQLIPF